MKTLYFFIHSIQTGKLATHDIEEILKNSSSDHDEELKRAVQRGDTIQEEDSIEMPPPAVANSTEDKKYMWRIDLAKTETHWVGWFKGLSAAFLNVPSPKMLLLAGVDRLDRELTVGQMQGEIFFIYNCEWKIGD